MVLTTLATWGSQHTLAQISSSKLKSTQQGPAVNVLYESLRSPKECCTVLACLTANLLNCREFTQDHEAGCPSEMHTCCLIGSQRCS